MILSIVMTLFTTLSSHAVEEKFCFYNASPGWSKLHSLNAQAQLMHLEFLNNGEKSQLDSDLSKIEEENCITFRSGPKLMDKIRRKYDLEMANMPRPGKEVREEFDVYVVYDTPTGPRNQVFFSSDEKRGVYFDSQMNQLSIEAKKVHKNIIEYIHKGKNVSPLKAYFGLGRAEKTYPHVAKQSEKYYLLVNGRHEPINIKSFYALPRR